MMTYANGMQQGLSTEQLQRWVPSAFAATPYHAQSAKYAFIPTSRIIDGMRSAGFVPVKASQSGTRIEDKRGFTKHMIRFRNASALTQAAVVGDSVLEAVLVNSHDGTSAYKLMCGIFRFVCSNGMVVADSMLESISVRHTGNVIDEVVEGTTRVFEQGPRVMDTIREWQGITLAPAEQRVLAESAHELRFPRDDDGKVKVATLVSPDHLLSARRSADQGSDLWSTFNRVQENAIKGIRTWGRDARGRVERVSSRMVKGIDGDVRLNRALWSLAEKMAAIKAA